MPRACRVLALLALTLIPRAAFAEGGAYGFFVAGHTPGEPTTPKVVTTYSLYGASLLSLGASAYFFVDWSRVDVDRTEFNEAEPNACADYGSVECGRASALDRDANRSLSLGFGALAAGVTLGVSGVLLAEVWPTSPVRPADGVSPEGGWLLGQVRF